VRRDFRIIVLEPLAKLGSVGCTSIGVHRHRIVSFRWHCLENNFPYPQSPPPAYRRQVLRGEKGIIDFHRSSLPAAGRGDASVMKHYWGNESGCIIYKTSWTHKYLNEFSIRSCGTRESPETLSRLLVEKEYPQRRSFWRW
jgi:hypothetical protein